MKNRSLVVTGIGYGERSVTQFAYRCRDYPRSEYTVGADKGYFVRRCVQKSYSGVSLWLC